MSTLAAILRNYPDALEGSQAGVRQRIRNENIAAANALRGTSARAINTAYNPSSEALEVPMVSPDDLIGSGIPTKLVAALKGAGPLAAGIAGIMKPIGGQWINQRGPAQLVEHAVGGAEAVDPIADWMRGPFRKYLARDMATEDDVIRKLADEGVHAFDEPDFGEMRKANQWADLNRQHHNWLGRGLPEPGQVGVSPLGRYWENLTDSTIVATKAERAGKHFPDEPWLGKVDPEEKVYYTYNVSEASDTMQLPQLVHELRKGVASGKLNPQSMSVEKAIRFADAMRKEGLPSNKVNWGTNHPALVKLKEYPEQGLSWNRIVAPLPRDIKEGVHYAKIGEGKYLPLDERGKPVKGASVEPSPDEAVLAYQLKKEGDAMGHCVGRYCEKVYDESSYVFTLRDNKGEPHVTVELSKPKFTDFEQAIGAREPEATAEYEKAKALMDIRAEQKKIWKQLKKSGGLGEGVTVDTMVDDEIREAAYLSWLETSPRLMLKQVEGKGNSKPNAEYLPLVQDFILNSEGMPPIVAGGESARALTNAELGYHKGEFYKLGPNGR